MDNRKYGTFPVSDRYRPLLLDPSRDAQVKVCRYMVNLGAAPYLLCLVPALHAFRYRGERDQRMAAGRTDRPRAARDTTRPARECHPGLRHRLPERREQRVAIQQDPRDDRLRQEDRRGVYDREGKTCTGSGTATLEFY